MRSSRREEHTRGVRAETSMRAEPAQRRAHARSLRRDEDTRGARAERSIRAQPAQTRAYARRSCRDEHTRGARADTSIRAEPAQRRGYARSSHRDDDVREARADTSTRAEACKPVASAPSQIGSTCRDAASQPQRSQRRECACTLFSAVDCLPIDSSLLDRAPAVMSGARCGAEHRL